LKYDEQIETVDLGADQTIRTRLQFKLYLLLLPGKISFVSTNQCTQDEP